MTQHERRGGDPGDQTPGQIEQQIERTRERLTQNMDELGERLVVLVAELLEVVDHRLRRAQPIVGAVVRPREVGADIEELVLDALERLPQGQGAFAC